MCEEEIVLLNYGGYAGLDGVEFPVSVVGTPALFGDEVLGWRVGFDELARIGGAYHPYPEKSLFFVRRRLKL